MAIVSCFKFLEQNQSFIFTIFASGILNDHLISMVAIETLIKGKVVQEVKDSDGFRTQDSLIKRP